MAVASHAPQRCMAIASLAPGERLANARPAPAKTSVPRVSESALPASHWLRLQGNLWRARIGYPSCEMFLQIGIGWPTGHPSSRDRWISKQRKDEVSCFVLCHRRDCALPCCEHFQCRPLRFSAAVFRPATGNCSEKSHQHAPRAGLHHIVLLRFLREEPVQLHLCEVAGAKLSDKLCKGRQRSVGRKRGERVIPEPTDVSLQALLPVPTPSVAMPRRVLLLATIAHIPGLQLRTNRTLSSGSRRRQGSRFLSISRRRHVASAGSFRRRVGDS